MDATIGRRGLLIGSGALAATPLLGGVDAAAHGSGRHRPRTGADVAAARRWRDFRGQKVGVVTNPTGMIPIADQHCRRPGGGRVSWAVSSGPSTASAARRRPGSSEGTYLDGAPD